MLVLSRKKNETIVIGGCVAPRPERSGPMSVRQSPLGGDDGPLPEIRVTVIEIRGDGSGGGRVRLGIDAPRDVSVHRQKVWAKIQQEQGGEGVRCQVSGEPPSSIQHPASSSP
jgi:carbon storage regulator